MQASEKQDIQFVKQKVFEAQIPIDKIEPDEYQNESKQQ
jgi:hypothetical protein